MSFGSTLYRQFSSAKHYIDYFPAKTRLSALNQHCTSNFLSQCCLRRICTTLTGQYSYALWSQHGRYNIVQVIYLIKAVCLPWANIAQVISLCNVDPERSGHHCRLFPSAKMFVDCETICLEATLWNVLITYFA